jgi:guanylate kinase
MIENIIQANPLMIVISGPSGVGKDTVINNMKKRQMPFHFVVTATTRPRREKEVEGRDYYFVSHERFAEMIENDELLEYAYVYNDYKGIPKADVRKGLNSGKDVMLRIDVQGAATIRKIHPEAILIFLTPVSEEELVQRLKNRQSETTDEVAMRVAMARQEIKRINEFDYVVVNKNNYLDETVDTIMSIILAEHHRVKQRRVEV